MTQVRIADELRLDAPIDVVWQAIEDPAAHARWHPFLGAIAGGRHRRIGRESRAALAALAGLCQLFPVNI